MKISLVEATRSGRSRAEDSEASAQVTGRGLPLGAGHGVPAGPSQNGLFEIKKRFFSKWPRRIQTLSNSLPATEQHRSSVVHFH